MKAMLKNLFSTDINDLANFSPPDPTNFGFPLHLLVGPEGEDGMESFQVVVCTPTWLRETYGNDAVIIGRHYILMFEFNYEKIVNTIKVFLDQCIGETWGEVAEKVARLGKWEFEDYRDYSED